MAPNLVVSASTLIAMASTPIAVASNLRAMASNLITMASNMHTAGGVFPFNVQHLGQSFLFCALGRVTFEQIGHPKVPKHFFPLCCTKLLYRPLDGISVRLLLSSGAGIYSTGLESVAHVQIGRFEVV